MKIGDDTYKLKCDACRSTNIYVLRKGIKVCRRCGARTKAGKVVDRPE